jgi:ferredoxin-NADP reductase
VDISRRRFRRSFEQLRRDVAMVVGGFSGKRPPAFTTRERPVDRPSHVAERVAAVLAPRTVRVARVVRETADAVTLELEDPTGGTFHFTPGQFFTLLVPIGDEVLRRAYSVCSDVRDTLRVAVTVKRVADGVVSSHVNEQVSEGDLLQVLGPSGSFVVEPDATRQRTIVLLAGGSGVTPMMAIARAVLAREPKSRVALVYGNRALRDVIFRDAIDELATFHSSRFTVRHVLADPPAAWTGGSGILEERVVASELDSLATKVDLADADYFVCGPEPMMRAARAALRARGVPDARVLEERFTQPHLRAKKAGPDAGPQLLTIRTGGGAAPREVYVAPEQTLLEAGLTSGLKMDYSCAMGGCAACKVKLCDGDVEMEEPNCLTADERAAGYVLACVGRLRGPATIALPSQMAGDPAFEEGAKR